MSIAPTIAPTPPAPGFDRPSKREVRVLIEHLFPQPSVDERRAEFRYPYSFLVALTPVDGEGGKDITLSEGSVVVVGKDLSERGFGFFHEHPLPYRRAIVTLSDNSGYSVRLLIDLAWCRFTTQGWYESGGRFLEVVSACAV